MERIVKPEILDELDGSDPRAVRSRRDLRFINFLMGNERWIGNLVSSLSEDSWSVSELGAGRGEFTSVLAQEGRKVLGYDFQPEPAGLPDSVSWSEGDFFRSLEDDSSEVVVGNLILHHFQDEQLAELGALFKNKKRLIFTEPLRSSLSLAEGYLLWPLINDVTRHDMIVSIRAGFRPGELPEKLGLQEGWEWKESTTICGGLRSIGSPILTRGESEDAQNHLTIAKPDRSSL